MGRLAMRREGDWWVAYFAKLGTMDGAIELGRLRILLAESDSKIKSATLEYYKTVVSRLMANSTGAKLEWPTPPQAAPESERSGRA